MCIGVSTLLSVECTLCSLQLMHIILSIVSWYRHELILCIYTHILCLYRSIWIILGTHPLRHSIQFLIISFFVHLTNVTFTAQINLYALYLLIVHSGCLCLLKTGQTIYSKTICNRCVHGQNKVAVRLSRKCVYLSISAYLEV